MDILNPEISLDIFFADLSGSAESTLILDYDGTLAPFRADRNKAAPYPGVRKQLADLVNSSRTRIIIVSGRAVSDLLPLLALDNLPEIWGCHGVEHYNPDTAQTFLDMSPRILQELSNAKSWARRQDLGRYLEDKPAGLAFHWRGLSYEEQDVIANKIRSKWRGKITGHGLALLEFDGGIELRPAGVNKGSAVSAILQGCSAEAVIAYLGDDLTDEAAFEALNGRGLRVLVRKEKRATRADIHIVPPEELQIFLGRWIAAAS